MVGVKKNGGLIADTDGSLIIKFSAKANKGINYLKISLNAMDLYDMEFKKLYRKADPKLKELGIKVMTDHQKTIAVKKKKSTYIFTFKNFSKCIS